MALSKELHEILRCPICMKRLDLKPDGDALKCPECKRVYAIKNDIPDMLVDKAVIEE